MVKGLTIASARNLGPQGLPPKSWVSCKDVLEPTQKWDSGPTASKGDFQPALTWTLQRRPVSIGYWNLSTGPCLRAVPLLFLVVVTHMCEGFSQSHEEFKEEQKWGSSPPFLELVTPEAGVGMGQTCQVGQAYSPAWGTPLHLAAKDTGRKGAPSP